MGLSLLMFLHVLRISGMTSFLVLYGRLTYLKTRMYTQRGNA